MEGTRVSHYDILERLGGGGMGVVYKALDTKLNRHVALKFLPPEMTRDDEARTRFIHEAQAASALDHPNICTIHEIDATPEGQMFIVMSFYDGATLKRRIDDGPLSIEESIDVASQMAQGLAKAHEAGIVHRDIKPANVMLTQDGFVKILDFGIAKLLGVTGPTQTGSTLGTVSYMSPEQVAGRDADPRSDVWALGAVLYEMLTGHLPFEGESQWVVMNAIASRDPETPSDLRPDLPDRIGAAVLGALEKDPSRRTSSANAFREQLEASRLAKTGGSTTVAAPPGLWELLRRPAVAIPAAGVVLVLAFWSVSSASQGAEERRAREETLPQVLALVEQDQNAQALELVRELEEIIPNDPVLAEASAAASVTGDVITDPPGADIYLKAYGDPEGEWEYLGQSPLESVRVPRVDAIQLRAELPGFGTRTVATGSSGFYFGRPNSEPITLLEEGAIPPEMVYVPGGSSPLRITGGNLTQLIELDAYLIDRYEVTNADFAEFVDAGAYERPELWEGLTFVRDGETLSWDEAMAYFVDVTGRPGPATWELGEYPQGRAAHPVQGVSWYEAAAYARFRGKELPTIYHWSRAAFEPIPVGSLETAMEPLSNFFGEDVLPVGESGAMGAHGTFDTAGNVREWLWNASGDYRWLLGGAWNDESYMASLRYNAPPFDRSPKNGFRTARYLEGDVRKELTEPVEIVTMDFAGAEAVSDEVYEIYRRQMSYVPSDPDPRVEADDLSTRYWTREHVSIDAGHSGERMSVYVFLPESADPPYQALVMFPGMGAFITPGRNSTDADLRAPGRQVQEGIVRSGRAMVFPVWKGSFERWDDFLFRAGDDRLRMWRQRMTEWVAEAGQVVDYLSARGDIDAEAIAYNGVSFGASVALPVLSLEQRFRAALLLLPGFPLAIYPPETLSLNHAPRITLPVLMIGGEYDYIFPRETSQEPLFRRLGTPEQDKRHVVYEMGHGPLPVGLTLRDVLPWLDEYLGPVD